MKKIKILLGIAALFCAAIAIFFVLSSENALVVNPKGLIAHRERELIITNILLMLVIIIPTIVLLFVTAFKYHSKNSKLKYDPEHTFGAFGEVLLWIIPSIVVAVMAFITWNATHELDPHKPLVGSKPMTIQVIAMDWKWVFIYPEQGIATVNFVQFPANTPIHLELTADGSPMNAFWIPQLSGQIYSMAGMRTELHLIADAPGEYTGKAAEINGKGYADMTFIAKSMTQPDFDKWIAKVKRSAPHFSENIYRKLVKPSRNDPPESYSNVEEDLFKKIILKYVNKHKKL